MRLLRLPPNRGQHLFGGMFVESGVIQIEVREDDPEERFGFVETVFQSFDILRGGVAPTVGRLVISTFYARLISYVHPKRGVWVLSNWNEGRTVAVDGAVGARLLPVALDLLAPTLIAGPGHPTSLLHG